jgi:hypothetical protein
VVEGVWWGDGEIGGRGSIAFAGSSGSLYTPSRPPTLAPSLPASHRHGVKKSHARRVGLAGEPKASRIG